MNFKNLVAIFLSVILLGCLGAQTQASASPSIGVTKNPSDYVKGQILVGFKPGVELTTAKALVSGKGLTLVQEPEKWEASVKWLVVKVPEGQEQKWITAFEKESIVAYAELNGIARVVN